MPKQRHLSHVQIVIIVTEAWYLSNYGYRSIFAVMYTAIVNALEISTALPVKLAHRYNTYKEGKLITLSILQLVLYLYLYMNYVRAIKRTCHMCVLPLSLPDARISLT